MEGKETAEIALADDLEAVLREQENKVNDTARDMGRLRGEFAYNARKLEDSFYPRLFPYVNAVHMNSHYQTLLDAEIKWLEAKVVAMEQHGDGFFELRDMSADRKELFDSLNPLFEDAYLGMERVTEEELAVLRGYDNPPQVVLDTIATVMTVRGEEDTSLEAAKIMLSKTYYYSFFVSKCRNQIKSELTESQLDALERYLLNPEHTPENVARTSAPCGHMALWLSALNLYYHYGRITSVKQRSLEETKDTLATLRFKLQEKKDDIRGAKEKLDELNGEMNECLAELRSRYDLTMEPLHETFLEANSNFNQIFCSPRRRMEEGMSPYRDADNKPSNTEC